MKRTGAPEIYVGRRYSDFAKMHKQLRMELAGKVLPPLPRKNKANGLFSANDDDDDDSLSSGSGQDLAGADDGGGSLRPFLPFAGGHRRNSSATSLRSGHSARRSTEYSREPTVLYREEQRVSLRAFLRTLLQHERIAKSRVMADFLTADPITLNEEELVDIERRAEMDEKRLEEQRQFYEIARKRARELDVHMEKFRREIVERSKKPFSALIAETDQTFPDGLSKLFQEIKEKNKIAELKPEYQKFAEWLRIEYVILAHQWLLL